MANLACLKRRRGCRFRTDSAAASAELTMKKAASLVVALTAVVVLGADPLTAWGGCRARNRCAAGRAKADRQDQAAYRGHSPAGRRQPAPSADPVSVRRTRPLQ